MTETIEIKNHGFIPDVITPDQYVFGGFSKIKGEKLMPGGHGWGEYLPLDEMQKRNGLETMNCSNYGTHNALEILFLRVFGLKFDFSERYSGVLTGTTQGGNSPHKVIELERTEIGFIDENLLPFSDDINTWEEYYSPNPMSPGLMGKGSLFLKKYKVEHEWVFVGGTIQQKQEAIKESLELSPLGVSVVAWRKRGEMFYKELGESDNHWCVLYDFVEGECWLILDTYDFTIKKLEWNYDFGFSKRYFVELNKGVKKNWFQDLIARFIRIFKKQNI